MAMAHTHGRHGRPWERVRRQTIDRAVADGIPCPWCHELIDPPGRWPKNHPKSPSADHIVPLSGDPSRGNDPTNLRAMHFGCNSSRGDGTRVSVKRAW